MLELSIGLVVGLIAGYIVGNGRARSVKNDLDEFYTGLLNEANDAYDSLYQELQEVKAKLTRKKPKA